MKTLNTAIISMGIVLTVLLPNSCRKATEMPQMPSFIELSIPQPYKVETGTKFDISVAPQEDATYYKWVIPENLQIMEGAGTNKITVKCMSEGEIAQGTIKVFAVNDSGESNQRAFWFDITIIPRVIAIGSSINGSQAIYPGETFTLTAPEIEGITSYVWNCPEGFTALDPLTGLSVRYKSPATPQTIERDAFKLEVTDSEGMKSEYTFHKHIHILDITKAKRYGRSAWTLKNLNNAGSDGTLGKVFDDDASGEKYGRYYSWGEAMTGIPGAADPYTDGDVVVDSEGVSYEVGYAARKDFGIQIQGACPEGWHIPNAYDYYDLCEGVADDYGVRKSTIQDCAASKSGIFMPDCRETDPFGKLNLMINVGFVASYLRGGRPAADGGLWKASPSTVTEDGYYFYTSGTGAFPAANDYPMYLDLDGKVGYSMMPYGRIEADGKTNPNFGLYSFIWTATVTGGKHYRLTIGYNTCNFSNGAIDGEKKTFMSVRCVANY